MTIGEKLRVLDRLLEMQRAIKAARPVCKAPRHMALVPALISASLILASAHKVA